MENTNTPVVGPAYGETLALGTDGKYRIEYTKNREYQYRVMRGNDDVTEFVTNNPFSLMFWDLLKAKGLY